MTEQSVVDLFKQIAGNQFGFFSRLNSVTDLMNRQIPTVSCDDTFGQVVGRAKVKSIESRAIIDPDDGDVIGVLKGSTICRCYPRFLNTLAEQDDDAGILKKPVSTMATRPVAHLPPTATPLEAIDILLQDENECLLIYEDPKSIMGVLTPIEFAKTIQLYYQVYNETQPLQRLRLVDLDELPLDEVFFRGAQTARDIMSLPATLNTGDSALTALAAMHENHTTVIPLLDKDGLVSGVLSLQDLLIGLAAPDNLQIFGQRPELTDAENESLILQGSLSWLPWETMRDSNDPALRDSAQSLAGTKASAVEPTTRLQAVISQLIESEDNVLLVKNGEYLEGVITLTDVLRIFKTLLKIGNWKAQ